MKPCQVSTADVSRSAIDRLQRQLEQVREVIAYCEQKSPRDEDGIFETGYYEAMYESPAYRDVASRLTEIVGRPGGDT